MSDHIIQLEHWPRKEVFQHYLHQIPCTYSITGEWDITPLRRQKLRLYPTMLYLLAWAVNQHEEFRLQLDEHGQLWQLEQMHPSYTVFHPETELFSNLWTEYSPDYITFVQRYEKTLETYGQAPGMFPQPDMPHNTFPVSMLPWSSFTGFQLNLQKGYDYLTPIFTMGKYFERHGRIFLPYSVQVHHAVCDGFHTCRLTNEIQQHIDTFAK